MEGAVEVSKEELAMNLLKRASDEIRQLRQIIQHQGAQILIFEKIAKIAGWQRSTPRCIARYLLGD